MAKAEVRKEIQLNHKVQDGINTRLTKLEETNDPKTYDQIINNNYLLKCLRGRLFWLNKCLEEDEINMVEKKENF